MDVSDDDYEDWKVERYLYLDKKIHSIFTVCTRGCGPYTEHFTDLDKLNLFVVVWF